MARKPDGVRSPWRYRPARRPVWADGVYVNVRLEDTDNKRQCILVLIGATREGTKELIAITDGYRESEQSWRELLLDVRDRGLTIDPDLAIGDGGLGVWGAVRKVFPKTREQRCWVHKTANVLNKLPKGVQAKAKSHAPRHLDGGDAEVGRAGIRPLNVSRAATQALLAHVVHALHALIMPERSTPPSIVCYIPNLLGGAASFRQSRYVWAST